MACLTHGKRETRFVEAESNPDLIYGGKQAIDPVRSSEVNSRRSAVAGQRQRGAKAGGDVQSLIRQLRAVYLDAARNATPSQGAGTAYTADQLAYTRRPSHGNDWATNQEGPAYRSLLEQRGIGEKIRGVAGLRGQYRAILEQAFDQHAPGVRSGQGQVGQHSGRR